MPPVAVLCFLVGGWRMRSIQMVVLCLAAACSSPPPAQLAPQAPPALPPPKTALQVSAVPPLLRAPSAEPVVEAEDTEWGGARQSGSGYVCGLRAARATTEKMIADEKKYSAEVGVVNLARLQVLKEQLRAIDHGMENEAKKLHDVGRELFPCDSRVGQGIVGKIARCVPIRVQMPDKVIEFDAPGSKQECADKDVRRMRRKFFGW